MDQKPTTIAEHFDRMILPHASGDDTAADGRRRLALRKAPERRLLPMLHRQMSQVDPRLVAVFRKLIAGEAAWPLFVHGDVGTGKTLAALSLADFATTASYWTVESLCDCIMTPTPMSGRNGRGSPRRNWPSWMSLASGQRLATCGIQQSRSTLISENNTPGESPFTCQI